VYLLPFKNADYGMKTFFSTFEVQIANYCFIIIILFSKASSIETRKNSYAGKKSRMNQWMAEWSENKKETVKLKVNPDTEFSFK
jgi:hypothetical protein